MESLVVGTEINMTESNNTAYANISVLQNSPNGPIAFNITAYDRAGNEFNVTQDDASANVIIDTTNPALSNLTIYSNNFNTSLATLGDTLNITITANEDLSSANITLLDATYTMSITDMVANASVIVNASHADGKVEFNITAFDLAGNSLTVNQAQLDSPNITIDKNVPSVTNLIFALDRSSFAVIVMFRISPKVASEVLKLLLYMVRFESAGLVVSIMTFADASSCVTLNSLPALSYAVMLNATGPFGEFCRTEMFAYAVLFDSVMFISVPRISKVAL